MIISILIIIVCSFIVGAIEAAEDEVNKAE